jgi:hypothetical protein
MAWLDYFKLGFCILIVLFLVAELVKWMMGLGNTDFYIILVAVAIISVGFPLTGLLAEKAEIPDYGSPQVWHPWWVLAYVLTIFPTALAMGYLFIIFFLVMVTR